MSFSAHPSLLFSLLLSALSITTFAERQMILEMEDFDGLHRRPFHLESAPGWYAREANCRVYGADGGGYLGMIHETATNKKAVKTLSEPWPAGSYLVFIRAYGNRYINGPTRVRVAFGDQAGEVEWKTHKRWKWVGPVKIEAKQAIRQVSVEALILGGRGYKQLYNPMSPTLAIDRLYITSDLSKTDGPKAAEVQVDYARDAYADANEVKGASTQHPISLNTPQPAEPAAAQPIVLEGGKSPNLLPNSSFELVGNDGWFGLNSPGNAHIFTDADRVAGGASHGGHSLAIPNKPKSGSRLYVLANGGTHTFSIHAKAKSVADKVHFQIVPLKKTRKGPGTRHNWEKPAIAITTKVTTSWQRFQASGELPAGPFMILVHAESESNGLQIDALQLEAGEQTTAYQPKATVEGLLTTRQIGHILRDDKATELLASFYNSGKNSADAAMRYEVRDVNERVVYNGTVKLNLKPGASETPIALTPMQRGIFSVLYGMNSFPEGELVYSVLSRPQGKIRHVPASNIDPNDDVIQLMAGMDQPWQLYCKLRGTFPQSIHPDTKTWRFDQTTSDIKSAQAHGMQVLGCMWPTRIGEHLADPALNFTDGDYSAARVPNRASAKRYPVLKKWQDYCRELAKNVGDLTPWWCIEDETEMYYDGPEFARIVDATIAGFAESGKDMKVGLSCVPDYTDEVFYHMKSDPKSIAAVGASSYNFEYWEARKVRALQNRYGIPWFCIGVGSARQPQMQHSLPGYREVYSSAARTAREMIYLCLVQDAKVIGHYTGRMMVRKGMYNEDYPLMSFDGTPLPHGYTYFQLTHLLADAVPVEDIYLESLGTMLFVYENREGLAAVTWANNTPNLDIHYRTEPRQWNGFNLAATPQQVEVQDMYGNARNDIEARGGRLHFRLDEAPTFIINRGLSREAFLAALRGSTAPPPKVRFRMAFLPGDDQRLDLAVHMTNTNGTALSDLKLTANAPDNRMVSKTSWTLRETDVAVGQLANGQSSTARLPLNINREVPLENANYTVWLTDKTGKEWAWYETCWLNVAAPGTSTVDGKLDEWDRRHPAWLYTTTSWGRFGRHDVQLYQGGETFHYTTIVDGQAAVYSRWDSNNLYFAFECWDDSQRFSGAAAERDQLTIILDPEPAAGFDGLETAGKFTVTLVPDGQAVAVTAKNLEAGQVTAKMSVGKDDISAKSVIELAIPWTALGIAPKSHKAIGFDVLMQDADQLPDGKLESGTLRWAGRSRTLGQLYLR